MAVFVALFLIFGGMSLRFLLQRLSIDTSYTAETEIQRGNELFDSYGPDALSMTWEDFQVIGIGPKQRPPFFVWQQIARQRAILAAITGGLALTFLVCAIGTWLSARSASRKQLSE